MLEKRKEKFQRDIKAVHVIEKVCHMTPHPPQKNSLEPREPKWKQVKTLVPHCPVCEEQLRGNNSGLMPYECSCGVWRSDFARGGFNVIELI